MYGCKYVQGYISKKNGAQRSYFDHTNWCYTSANQSLSPVSSVCPLVRCNKHTSMQTHGPYSVYP